LHRDEKQVLVAMGIGAPVAFNVSQTKPASIADPSPALQSDTAHFVYITEIVHPGDPRESLFGPAIKNVILGLIDRGTFQIVIAPEDTTNLNILPSRFVLEIKRTEDGTEKLKARFVISGNRDRLKTQLVHIASTVRQTHVRLIIALAAVFGFDVWTADVRQAYLQATTPLLRDVFVKTDTITLERNELLRFLKPLYGLSDSGDYWARTLSNFHLEQLQLQQSTGDFALFFRRIADKLMGLSSSLVDDLLQAGTHDFRLDMEREFKRAFDMSSAERGNFAFAGVQALTGR
jgi:hypothetical protein